jgi:epimerase transport system membrane fusion protein
MSEPAADRLNEPPVDAEAAPPRADAGQRGKPAPDSGPPLHPAANVRNITLAGLFTVAVVFGGFGTWAAVAPLAGAVIGRGEVKVDLNRKTVQHFEGGIVSEILVRDGDRVTTGQTLIVVVDERVSASVDVLRGHLDAEIAKAARLEAQRDEREEFVFPEELLSRADEPAVAELLRTEGTFFRTKREAMLEEVKLLNEQIAEARTEIEGLQQQVSANRAAVALLKEEIEANESLERSQYVQRVHLLGLKRMHEEYQGRHGQGLAEIARARQRIAEMELRIVQLRDNYVQRAVEDLTGVFSTGVYARIFDLRQRLRPSQDAQRRQRIVAPISGTVVDLRVFTVGGVIRSGEPLLDIVPDDNPLIVEARIRVDDIDSVREGQEADIRFSAFKRRATPLVSGIVSYVSADRLVDDVTGEFYYLTHVHADAQSLSEAGIESLHPGMPAEVFIRTGERTALQYLLAPITDTLRRSFRES